VSASRAQRRWLVPEVVQTSAMDCGPASLKCVLEGFRIPVSYGRLREACQTDIDGTSIDAIETIANQLGVAAEQVMIPADHLFLTQAAALPAVVVVKHSDGATHFVVVWRRHGSWLQVMDPAIGRRWVRIDRFTEEVFRHETSVSADGWRVWAASDDFLGPLRQRLAQVGTSATGAASLIDRALEESNWFGLGALDASVRFVASLIEAGGLSAGAHASNLVNALFVQTYGSTDDIHRIIPRVYWSVVPDKRDAEGALHLTLRGVVLVRLQGRRASGDIGHTSPLSPELAAALAEKPVNALTTIWTLLKTDGILGPAALIGAMGLAAGAVLLEILLFRGLFDISWALNLPSQRLAAVAALLAFGALLLLVEIPIVMESMRFGRHLEARLRMALLRKLPQLTDRYFHSRPVSDMADRSHSIHLSRLVPGLGLHFVQAMCDLTFTLIGIVIIDPQSVGLALAIAGAAMVLPLAIQPLVNERDLRVRNHAGALSGFYLDALLALVPIRAHGAAQAVRRQHEGLLVEWARSTRGLIRLSMSADAVQSLVCLGLAGLLLLQHFLRSGGATGGDLLLVYWTLKLPAIGQGISQLAQQYPAQRNVLLRLLEPLSAPTEIAAGESQTRGTVEPQRNLSAGAEPARSATRISIENGSVLAGGHALLRDIDLAIAPGEHVAIVGASGAGKSTLVGLMLGWHRLAEGTLLLDGERSTPSGLERLRREIAWVDPAIQIWNRPFLENLNYAVDADYLERTGSAIDTADLRRLLQKLPDGLQTWLGEGGALLSGGEGQRVRLARALMQSGVRLAVLDEPFRGMDRAQRTRLLAEARAWWKDATLLCVTHDVGETLAFDRVLVVEAGRIIEDGAPSRLKASKSRYRELLDAENTVRSQMWQGAQWRRLRVDDGRIQAGGPRALPLSRPHPPVRAAK
jgi:ATP-binding cassette subfamily B protein